MYDMIPQCGALQDVLPGDIWQPEPAARYNAVNDLLRQEQADPGVPVPVTGSECIITVCNATEKTFSIGSAVQLDTSFVPDPEDTRLWHRNIRAYGRPVENEYSIWGVALDNIHPESSGPVQISGAAMIRNPLGEFEKSYKYNYYAGTSRTVRNNFIFPGRDGRYHFGKRGGAEVIWYDKYSGWTLVRLGAKDHSYTGMFAVIENGDGTLTVKGGETDLTHSGTVTVPESGSEFFVPDTVIKVEGGQADGRVIVLQATYNTADQPWKLEILASDYLPHCYEPGKKIYWELARYSGVDHYGYLVDFQQLWQGGMINFRDRYYIEQ
ncbi:MAG: hypothetical protein IJV93_07145 [Lentisphaeria bacterium]|nr:hypothetical protein [Lentisphaeria bacterium]